MWDLGKLGFVWQFITVSASRKYFAERDPLLTFSILLQLAGLHSNAYISDLFAKGFSEVSPACIGSGPFDHPD